MAWLVQRDTGEYTGNTGLVLVACDHELLTDEEANELIDAIRKVASGQAYYVGNGGGGYATQAEWDAQP